MNILNKTVRHKTYGDGTICSFDENIVSVKFATTIKKFIYPDAFRDFLFINESQSREFIENKLAQQDEENRLKREQEEKAAELQRLLESLPLDPNAQAAFGFINNDKQQTALDWTVNTGRVRTGYSKGQPRVPARLYPNSACLLTYRENDEPEEMRYIWGVFMVREDFVGPNCLDGIIKAHDKYRILLSDTEARKLLFWDYFNDTSKVNKWGLIEHRYFSNEKMADIIGDILALKRGTEEQDLCEKFLAHYCNMNKIALAEPADDAED